MLELQRLLDQGYEVSFTKGPDGYVAEVCNDVADVRDGIAVSTGEALWAASPLHDEDAPYPGDIPDMPELKAMLGAVMDTAYERGRKDGVPALERYDRGAHLTWYEKRYPDAENWPMEPLTDDEAVDAIAEYTDRTPIA